MEHLTFDEAVKVFTLFCKTKGASAKSLGNLRVRTKWPTGVSEGDIRSPRDTYPKRTQRLRRVPLGQRTSSIHH